MSAKLQMFTSARVKLTLFYLAILLAFSLTLTITFRVLFAHEYGRSSMAERSGVRQLFSRGLYLPGPRPYSDFNDLQAGQAGLVRTRLNRDFLFINVGALVIGGLVSYWFAGRTLRPIQRAHDAQARFAADASHELRTPLTNLRLENEVFLRQKHFSQDDARQLINSNLEEVQRLEGLAGNLLAITQYEHTELKLQPISIEAVARAATQQVQKAASERQATFTLQVPPAKVLGYQDSLEQCVAILLDNAVKYGPDKGTITIGGRSESGHYLLWVQDTGPGISPTDMPHIFERLYRGDKARSNKVSGYGLGLALAASIARANNAEIRAQNVPDGGACFVLRLELAE